MTGVDNLLWISVTLIVIFIVIFLYNELKLM